MRVFLFSLLLACTVLLPAQTTGKDILAKTEEIFRKTNGIQADFYISNMANGVEQGTTEGNIILKGNQFVLAAGGVITWFNGTTQWSYMVASDEVNISEPTEEELQTINPYAFLSLYKEGFNCNKREDIMFKGNSVFVIEMTPTLTNQTIECITLYIRKDNYAPSYILIKAQGQEESQAVTINSFDTSTVYNDDFFKFNSQAYPTAEIIDLR